MRLKAHILFLKLTLSPIRIRSSLRVGTPPPASCWDPPRWLHASDSGWVSRCHDRYQGERRQPLPASAAHSRSMGVRTPVVLLSVVLLVLARVDADVAAARMDACSGGGRCANGTQAAALASRRLLASVPSNWCDCCSSSTCLSEYCSWVESGHDSSGRATNCACSCCGRCDLNYLYNGGHGLFCNTYGALPCCAMLSTNGLPCAHTHDCTGCTTRCTHNKSAG